MTLSEEVYLKIREDVNTLAFGANEFLNEQRLAERYQVSKAPVRSALHRLCMEGILISYPRKGYVIHTLSDAEFQQAQALRVVNESYALELISQRAGREQLLDLRRTAGEGNTVRDNNNFHLALGRLSENGFLLDVIERLLCAVTRTLNMYTFDSGSNDFQTAHINIADALLEGELALAKLRLREDILR